MVFSSVSFLFFFLPLTLGLSLAVGSRFRNHVLLACSLVFYFWGEAAYTLLLLSSIVFNTLAARVIAGREGGERRLILALAVAGNFLALFVFKYAAFARDSLNPLLAAAGLATLPDGTVHLPAGISFFTFQAVSYLVDVHRREVQAESSMVNSGLYIALFPQLIAGPIVRYHDIAAQLRRRSVNRADFAAGIERFVFGLGKKVLLADPLGEQADRVFAIAAADLSTATAWLGALCFALQIYYDFSGYSDMAIGLGRLFGFSLPENFNYPYISRSMREFWRRWHITLSTWLRDYLYIPLGGGHGGRWRTARNLVIVFFACGLWHGANWTFVVWGLWHGLFLVVERFVPGIGPRLFRQGFSLIHTFVVVMIGWVIFRSPSLVKAWDFVLVMAGAGEAGLGLAGIGLEGKLAMELGLGILLVAPLFPLAVGRLKDQCASRRGTAAGLGLEGLQGLIRLGLFGTIFYFNAITVASRAYNPFLYFQF